MVSIESANHGPKPAPLLWNWRVRIMVQLLRHLSQLRLKPSALRLPPQLEALTITFLAADMRKTEKREGLRLSTATPRTIACRKTAELDQACLPRMKLQRKLRKTPAQIYLK
jgi:hypothetical protein